MKITKSRLKQIIQEEIQKLNEADFTKLGYGRPELQGPRSLGPARTSVAGDPDGPEDDAAELRDVADDLESKSPYAAEYERKSSAKAEIADQIRELSLALKDVPEEDWRTLSDLRSKIQDLQAAMIDAGDRGGWN